MAIVPLHEMSEVRARRSPDQGPRVLNWLLTCNNPSAEEIDSIRTWVADARANYVMIGFETGEEGTEHFHAYVQFC